MVFTVLVLNSDKSTGLNFVRCLQLAKTQDGAEYCIVGVSFDPIRAQLAQDDNTIILPKGMEHDPIAIFREVTKQIPKINLVYQTKSAEYMLELSKARNQIPVFLPSEEPTRIFEDKYETYLRLSKRKFPLPKTTMPKTPEDVRKAVNELGTPEVWVRKTRGQAGKGSFSTADSEEIIQRLKREDAWGEYLLAERLPSMDLSHGWEPHLSDNLLPGEMLTWAALYFKGKLVASQTRKRLYWEHADLTASGVTGYSGANMTVSRNDVHKLCDEMVRSIDPKPNGALGADFVVAKDGTPKLTEIQASRFYTSTYPLALLGLNLPHAYLQCAAGRPPFYDRINPCKAGMVYIQRFGSPSKMVYKQKIVDAIRAVPSHSQ